MQLFPGTLFLKTLQYEKTTKYNCFILCIGNKQLCITNNRIVTFELDPESILSQDHSTTFVANYFDHSNVVHI